MPGWRIIIGNVGHGLFGVSEEVAAEMSSLPRMAVRFVRAFDSWRRVR